MKYKIPSISALKAFEAAARLCNFSHAAAELHTSQSAISRHIAALESQLGVNLFNRFNRKLTLSEAGNDYYMGITKGLENLHVASRNISNYSNPDVLTIACTHEISHLYLMPRFDAIQANLDQKVMIQVMTFEYDDFNILADSRIDIKLAYQLNDSSIKDRRIVLRESVAPVCSPGFASKHKKTLSKSPSSWDELPFLNIARTNKGWATWDDWFEDIGVKISPNYTSYYNYIYLLEAATSGAGIALGWKGLIERYTESGVLKRITNNFVDFERGLFAGLTKRGQQHPIAHQCLDVLINTISE